MCSELGSRASTPLSSGAEELFSAGCYLMSDGSGGISGINRLPRCDQLASTEAARIIADRTGLPGRLSRALASSARKRPCAWREHPRAEIVPSQRPAGLLPGLAATRTRFPTSKNELTAKITRVGHRRPAGSSERSSLVPDLVRPGGCRDARGW